MNQSLIAAFCRFAAGNAGRGTSILFSAPSIQILCRSAPGNWHGWTVTNAKLCPFVRLFRSTQAP